MIRHIDEVHRLYLAAKKVVETPDAETFNGLREAVEKIETRAKEKPVEVYA